MDILEILDRYAEGDEFQRPIETAIEEITKLREQVAAQAAAIEKLKSALIESSALNINWSSDAEPETLAYYSEYRKVIAMAEEALAIPTDSATSPLEIKL